MTKLLRRAVHYAIYLVAAGVIAVSVVALSLRFWIMPDIDRYRPDVERVISAATGLPVRIGALRADWEWLTPHLRLEDLRFLPPGQLPCLTLPEVDAYLSWTSLLVAEIRLASLEIVRPHLLVRRDGQGVVHVAGVPVNTPGARSPFPDWLLAQHRIIVRQGTVIWRDELLNAPPLTVSDLDLVLYNRFGRHRLGVTGRPPDMAARWLDLRADFSGKSVRQLDKFAGQLYARLEGASAEALRTWAPWAQEAVRSGVGALRLWLDFADGRAISAVSDIRLQDVHLSLTEDFSGIRFNRLAGRVGWRLDKTGEDYFVERLDFTSPDGQKVEGANVRVRLHAAGAGKPGFTRVEAEDLRLEALTALTSAIPVPERVHQFIEQLTPRGHVDHLKLDWRDRAHYQVEARFREVGIRSGLGLPGISGLTGEITASDAGGQASIRSRRLGVDYARVLRQPLAFEEAQANVSWEARKAGGHVIGVEDLRLLNADLDGGGRMRIELRPGAAPDLDLDIRLRRGAGNAVWRYLPWQVSDEVHDWVKQAIRSGISDDTRFILRGPLDRYPFDRGGGEFRVDVKVRDAEIEVAPGWPPFTRVNGRLTFHDKTMELQVERGMTLGQQVYAVKGIIPDMYYTYDEILSIEGRAQGATAGFLDYIRHSPVLDYTERFTEPLRATGQGELALRLTLPLRRLDATRVSGVFRARDNRLHPGRGLPVLERLSGDLAFTHRDIKAKGVSAVLLGQPTTLGLEGASGSGISLTLAGRAEVDALKEWIPPIWRERLVGATTYAAELALRQGRTELRLNSDLKGLEIRLPAPLAKPAERAEPLLVTHAETDDGKAAILARYGQVLTARALLGDADDPPRISVRVGSGEAALPKAAGLTLEAVQKHIDLDQWLALAGTGGAGGGLAINEIVLTANEMTLLERPFHDVHLKARPEGDAWRVRMASREVQGDLRYQPSPVTAQLQARLKRLVIPAGWTELGTAKSDVPLGLSADLQVDSLLVEERELGALRMTIQPEGHSLKVRQTLELPHAEGRLEADGLLSQEPRRRSAFRVRASTPDLGRLLTRLGHAGKIRGGETQVEGELGWLGATRSFSLRNLSGNLNIRIGKGQFPKLDPGAARLLGVVSLQSLPRRIALDFRDVFSEGFAFDEITTPVYLDRGVAYLANLRMRGPAASVEMKGQIDLLGETQALRVNVQPRLEETLAAGAILVNPAIGLGALVASKVLQDPISKAASFEYLVRGSWTEPEVTRLPRAKASGDENTDSSP